MGRLSLGSHDGKGEQTPTLRQYAKTLDNIAEQHVVTIIFKPNKFPNYTLVCDGKFRVQVPEGSELFTVLEEQLPQFINDEACLIVCTELEGAKKGVFELSIDTNENTSWEVTQWGVTGKVKDKKKATARGNRRKSVPK